ncbi:MAG: CapA family protein [Candidatus Nanopelagicales bacterium]|nr:CapA family protein [Candidatus Nanopelagicales bacterium]MDZ4249091.1 CapA family protein [Candidatus Nanopelagicales bacterium]
MSDTSTVFGLRHFLRHHAPRAIGGNMLRRWVLVLCGASLSVSLAACSQSIGPERRALESPVPVDTPAADSPAVQSQSEQEAGSLPTAATTLSAQGNAWVGEGDSPTTKEPITIAFAGDSYAEGPLAGRLISDPRRFVGPYKRVFRDADLVLLNLETAITQRGTPESKAFTFRSPRRVLGGLRRSGVDVVSMANNHGMDFGLTGFADSLAAKRAIRSPAIIGMGANRREAFAPWITSVKGQEVGFLAATRVLDDHLMSKWTAGPGKPGLASAYGGKRLVRGVRRLRSQVDTVVVYLHWGIEKETCPTYDQRELARRLVDAGADIVVGGHQHRVVGGGMMGNAVVHYGLGNFLFQTASPGSERTGVFTVDIDGRDVLGYHWIPGRISAAVPYPLTGEAARSERRYWRSLRGCTGLRR